VRTRRWAELTWPEFRDLPANTVAILPVAAIEQHGPHLPLSTDATINQGILDRALALLPDPVPALALPMTSVGISVEHRDYPGTLTISPETALALWTETGASVARAGVRRLLILNSHGGQPQIVEVACRRLRIEQRMLAVGVMWGRIRPVSAPLPEAELRHGIHAGAVETGLMLHLAPDLVRMQHAGNFGHGFAPRIAQAPALAGLPYATVGWMAQDLHPAGPAGDATLATPAIGAAVLEQAAQAVADLVTDMAAANLDTWLGDPPA
jgi:creatinine amidohydrolase